MQHGSVALAAIRFRSSSQENSLAFILASSQAFRKDTRRQTPVFVSQLEPDLVAVAMTDLLTPVALISPQQSARLFSHGVRTASFMDALTQQGIKHWLVLYFFPSTQKARHTVLSSEAFHLRLLQLEK